MDRGGGSFVDPIQRAVRQSEQDLQEHSSICLLDAVPRPDNGGREGRLIPVFANLFSTKFNSDLQITQFDVRFVQTKDVGHHYETQTMDIIFARPIMLKLFTLALTNMKGLTEKQIKSIVYDGAKNAFTCTNLPFPPGSSLVEVEVPQFKGEKRVGQLTMIVKQTNRFEIETIQDFLSAKAEFIKKFQKATTESVGRVLQAFNIAFRMDALEQCITTKNDKFFDSFNAKQIAQGAEIWSGFFQSVLPLRGGLFVNLDLAFSTFLSKGPLLEVAKKILENLPVRNNYYEVHPGRGGGRGNGFRGNDANNGQNPFQGFNSVVLQKLRKAFRNVKIGLIHRPQIKSKLFRGFTSSSAQLEMFMWNGKESSVADYYSKKYDIQLRFPHFPCAILGKDNRNSENKQWVPLELCLIVESAHIPPHKLSLQQVQDMLRQTKQSPQDRLKGTIDWRKERAYETNEKLTSWGIEVAHEPVQLSARELLPPQVAYRDNNLVQISNGSWNLRSIRFLRSGVPLITPVILNFSNYDDRRCEEFTCALFNKCRQFGMEIKLKDKDIRCRHIEADQTNLKGNIVEAAKETFKDGGEKCAPQLFICFMDYNTELYQQIKRISILELPTSVPTQCMDVRKTFENKRGEMQYMSNIAMKINDKLSGFNHVLPNVKDLPMIGQDTMMIGIDVRHPPARLQHDSVVAAVATLNGQGTRIGSQISTQFNPNLGHQQETVLDGKDMFIGLLKSWKKFNRDHLPKQIIVFRDGVSQGEYMQVKEFEVTQLKQACESTNSANDPTPKVAYVIATKKHHIRMFAKNERDLRDSKNGNLPAGTVADQVITHPFIFEFYLQAHTGIGCCRPCKYTVLQDEIHFTSDKIQRFINSLCYSHQRATRSVSRPPLVMYAHLLAYKAMFLLHPDIGSDLSSLGGSVRNTNLVGYSIEDVQQRLNMQNINPNKPKSANLVDNFSEVPWFL